MDKNYIELYSKDDKEGVNIKAQDVIILDAPEVRLSPDTPLLTNAQDVAGAINELFQLDPGGGDIGKLKAIVDDGAANLSVILTDGSALKEYPYTYIAQLITASVTTSTKSGDTTTTNTKSWSKYLIDKLYDVSGSLIAQAVYSDESKGIVSHYLDGNNNIIYIDGGYIAEGLETGAELSGTDVNAAAIAYAIGFNDGIANGGGSRESEIFKRFAAQTPINTYTLPFGDGKYRLDTVLMPTAGLGFPDTGYGINTYYDTPYINERGNIGNWYFTGLCDNYGIMEIYTDIEAGFWEDAEQFEHISYDGDTGNFFTSTAIENERTSEITNVSVPHYSSEEFEFRFTAKNNKTSTYYSNTGEVQSKVSSINNIYNDFKVYSRLQYAITAVQQAIVFCNMGASDLQSRMEQFAIDLYKYGRSL